MGCWSRTRRTAPGRPPSRSRARTVAVVADLAPGRGARSPLAQWVEVVERTTGRRAAAERTVARIDRCRRCGPSPTRPRVRSSADPGHAAGTPPDHVPDPAVLPRRRRRALRRPFRAGDTGAARPTSPTSTSGDATSPPSRTRTCARWPSAGPTPPPAAQTAWALADPAAQPPTGGAGRRRRDRRATTSIRPWGDADRTQGRPDVGPRRGRSRSRGPLRHRPRVPGTAGWRTGSTGSRSTTLARWGRRPSSGHRDNGSILCGIVDFPEVDYERGPLARQRPGAAVQCRRPGRGIR